MGGDLVGTGRYMSIVIRTVLVRYKRADAPAFQLVVGSLKWNRKLYPLPNLAPLNRTKRDVDAFL